MRSTKTMSRRAFIAFSGVVAGSIALQVDPTRAAAASAVSGGRARAVGAAAVASCFTADWSQRIQVEFPGAIDLRTVREVREVDFTWDERLFALDDVFTLGNGGAFGRATVSAGEGRARVRELSRASQIIPVVRALARYPEDAVDRVTATVVAVSAADDHRLVSTPQRIQATPWGVELSATWSAADSGVMCDLIVVRSVGPHPAPAGIEIAVTHTNPDRERPQMDHGLRTQSTKARQASFVLELPLKSGETKEVRFVGPDTRTSLGRSNVNPGIVQLRATAAQWASARETGRYEVASVTESGAALELDTLGA